MGSDCTGPVLAKTFRADLFGFLQPTLQVQKLLTRHKAELLAAQQAAAEESRRQLDVLTAEHQVAVRQLKDRLLKVRVRECGHGCRAGTSAWGGGGCVLDGLWLMRNTWGCKPLPTAMG